MKTILFLASLMLTAPVLAHDHPGMSHLIFSGGAVHAHVSWIQGPRTTEESIMRIEWKDGSTHAPIEVPGSFKVSLFMPDMGHGSSPTQLERALDENGNPLVGVYNVTSVYFTMGGDWEVRVALKPTSGATETQIIKVHLDENGGGHHH